MMLLKSSRPAEPGFDAMGLNPGKGCIRVHGSAVNTNTPFARIPVPHERRNLNGRAAPHPRSRPTSRRPQTLPRLAGMKSVGRVTVWNRSLASVALRAPWITTESSFGRGAVRARPGGIDDVELPRRTLGTRRCRGHDKRSPRLRRLEIEPEGVAGRHRVPFNPLNLPVRVATQSSRGRVFACASSMYLRSSKPLGSLHIAAYSRSAGRSKMVIPS
jgi:hypothetical protein